MSPVRSKEKHRERLAKAMSAVAWVVGIILLVIYLTDVLLDPPVSVGSLAMGLLYLAWRWMWLVIIFIAVLVVAIVFNSLVAKQHKAVKRKSAATQLPLPEACVSCGQPLKKGSRRCQECGYAWCLNCGAWNPPGASRCSKCTFVLPSR